VKAKTAAPPAGQNAAMITCCSPARDLAGELRLRAMTW
jgi:hypothetical protein